MNALPPAFYIILALLAFAVAGGLLVWLIGYIRGKGKQNSDDPSPVTSTEPEIPVRTSEPPPEPTSEPQPQPPAEEALLRVSRVRPGKDGLAIFVQGRRYHHLHEIRNPQMGRETVEALNAVLAFADGWFPARPQPPSQPEPTRRAASAEDEEAFLARLRQSDLFPEGTSSGLLGGAKRRRSSSSSDPVVPPAEAIDALVQQRLASRPELARYNIRMTTAEDGSLRIHVGLGTFSAVDEVQDSEVRALIQDAIREWGG
jgi:hypothetical protein